MCVCACGYVCPLSLYAFRQTKHEHTLRLKISEARTSTDTDAGRNPDWTRRSQHVFTFYVPATVSLGDLSLNLEVHNDNLVADAFIGTTGKISVDEVRQERGGGLFAFGVLLE